MGEVFEVVIEMGSVVIVYGDTVGVERVWGRNGWE